MSLTSAIQNLKDEMEKAGIVQEEGLGTELFHFSSTLAPVVNIDLLIVDERGRVLLSWRNDQRAGTGWHVPGSCIRFRETLEDAIQRCARNEIGISVKHSREPIKVFESHWKENQRPDLEDQRERAHFITLAYGCRPDGTFDDAKQNTAEGDSGYLRWFETIPEDILPIQRCYLDNWNHLKKRIMEEAYDELDE